MRFQRREDRCCFVSPSAIDLGRDWRWSSLGPWNIELAITDVDVFRVKKIGIPVLLLQENLIDLVLGTHDGPTHGSTRRKLHIPGRAAGSRNFCFWYLKPAGHGIDSKNHRLATYRTVGRGYHRVVGVGLRATIRKTKSRIINRRVERAATIRITVHNQYRCCPKHSL